MISLELIPWEQMVNGGLPTKDVLESQKLVWVHSARCSTEVVEYRVGGAHEAGLKSDR